MAQRWKAGEIARVLGIELPAPWEAESEIGPLFSDSRQPQAGGLFVPLRGENFNGHAYLASAREGGAKGSLWSPAEAQGLEPPPGFPLLVVDSVLEAYLRLASYHLERSKVRVAAITGSVGKTTTKDLLAGLLASKFRTVATVANHNNEIGVAQTLLALQEETEWAVVEMGMRARGEIARLAKLTRPQIALITYIGESHLELLGSREEIARAKGELLEESDPQGLAILPADSDFYPLLASLAPGRQTSFALRAPQAEWRLVSRRDRLRPLAKEREGSWRPLLWGQEIEIATPLGRGELFLPLPGEHNCANTLAALAAAREAGLGWEEWREALATCQLTAGRLQLEEGPGGTLLLDDAYNAAPSSMAAALEILAKLPALRGEGMAKGRRVAILGDMLELGPQSGNWHRQLGEMAAGRADLVLGVGPQSRELVEGALARGGRASWVADYRAALLWAQQELGAGDMILVKASHSIHLDRLASAVRSWGSELARMGRQ